MGNDASNDNADATELKIDLETLLDLYGAMQKIKMEEAAASATSNKINMKKDFKIFVGIDFGTNGCGIAYAIKNNLVPKNNSNDDDDSSDDDEEDGKDDKKDGKDDKKDNNEYEGEESDGYTIIAHQWSDLAFDNSKLNTCVLLNDKNELEYVGNYARVQFTETQNKDKKKNWKLFDNFKMSLYDNEEKKVDDEEKKVDNDDEKKNFIKLKHKIKSNNGIITDSDIVFCATLKYLKEEALKYIAERIEIMDITVDDIQWVLTIPALWNNESKHMMRQWGLASGLINEKITNHLKIVLEPECASLQIQHEFHNDKEVKFDVGDKYILVDAGGGTVDIVAHEIYSKFGVKEIIASCGGPYGSINIDKKLEELFDTIFGVENMNTFREQRAKEYVKWIENVVTAKCGFYSSYSSNTTLTDESKKDPYHSIELDRTFYNSIKNKTFNNQKFSKYLKSIQEIFGVNGRDIGIKIDEKERMFKISTMGRDYAYLEIHENVWKKIFDDNCLNGIIDIVKTIMTQKKDILNDTKYIFMVGGLSQSKWFQKRMKDEFKSIAIVIPKNPLLCVVCGACRYGYKTDFIHTRILKKTYAVRISATYDSLMMEHRLMDLVNYMENEDGNDAKDEEMEDVINTLITKFKEDGDEDMNTNDNKLQRERVCSKIKEQCDEAPIPKEWINANVALSGMAKELICNRLLSILARKGDEIEINSSNKITRTYQRWSKEQKLSNIEIYCSDEKNPRIIDDATKLCEGVLKYAEIENNNENDGDDGDNLAVIFEVSFDDSLLIAYVYPKGKENQRAELAMEYQTN